MNNVTSVNTASTALAILDYIVAKIYNKPWPILTSNLEKQTCNINMVCTCQHCECVWLI